MRCPKCNFPFPRVNVSSVRCPMPTLPDRITHPNASPEECARVREASGECVGYATVRTCDDAGVMTDELCGLGAWPCVRDGCGPGARCCVPGTFDAALGQSPEDTLVDTANTKTPNATTTTGSTSVMPRGEQRTCRAKTIQKRTPGASPPTHSTA